MKSKVIKPNNKFKAVFNPFTKELSVKYGNLTSEYVFTDLDEWTRISFNGDDKHPNYLHIHLHYDENLQLLFYPRTDDNKNLNESVGVYFNSSDMKNIPSQIKIVYTDDDYNKAILK